MNNTKHPLLCLFLSMNKKSSYFLLNVIVAVFLVASLIAGCAPSYLIKVDAITATAALESKDYILLPGIAGLRGNDLHFKAYSDYIVQILEDNGYRQVTKKEDCQLLIYLSYGIGEPKPTTYSTFAGMPGSPPPGNTTEQTQPEPAPATAYVPPYSAVRAYPFLYPDYFRDPRYYPGFYPRYYPGYYPGFSPPYEIYPLYQRYMILEAVDYLASNREGTAVPVWKVTVSSWGERNELRDIFPALVAAAGEYIGANTGKEIEVYLSGKDARIKRLKEPR